MQKYIFFYSDDHEIIIDIEKELVVDDKDFFLFLFHNRDLHFNKSVIFKEILNLKLDKTVPFTKIDEKKDKIKITKTITVNLKDFVRDVDKEFENYLFRINYRIDCIFQTFLLFNRLYSDKILLYFLPRRIIDNFNKFLNENNIEFNEENLDNIFDDPNPIFKKINLFIRQKKKIFYKKKFARNDIVKIIKII